MYDPLNNSLLEIFITSASLGGVTGLNVVDAYRHGVCPIHVYIQSVVMYFMMEFNVTAVYQSSKVHSKSFLLYGNVGNLQFLVMQLLSLLEHSLLWGGVIRTWNPHSVFGLFLIVCGLGIRYVGMIQCGESFSHIIDTDTSTASASAQGRNRELVTHGVYSAVRHPVYLGFWLFAQGIELTLHNWVMLFVVAITLFWFFLIRIPFEEYFLGQIYGEQYQIYKRKVRLGVPFIYESNVYI